MANPRKFSEKIALQKQKQAEGTAEFEKIMNEVKATRVVDNNTDGTDCAQLQRNASISGGSGGSGTSSGASGGGASPDTSGGGGGPLAPGSSPSAYRESRGRSVGVGPMRRPSERKQDRSPYGSTAGGLMLSGMTQNTQNTYLSPPMDTSWRRSNSDSALHQTLNMAEGNFGPSPQGSLMNDLNSLHANYHHHHHHHNQGQQQQSPQTHQQQQQQQQQHSQRSHSPNIGRSYSPQAQRRKNTLLQQQHQQQQLQNQRLQMQQHHQQQQLHQQLQNQQLQQQHMQQQHQQQFNAKFNNSNIPANVMFKSLQEQQLNFANTGSLPDLTSVHFATTANSPQLMQQQQQQQQQQQTLSPVLSPHPNNGCHDREQSPSPFSPPGCGSGGGGGPPSPYHQQQNSPTSAANTPSAANNQQTSPHLSFNNLSVQSPGNVAQANSTQNVNANFSTLPTLGAANSTGNLTDYRQPLNPPSPGSSPGLLTSGPTNDIHTSAPASPIRHCPNSLNSGVAANGSTQNQQVQTHAMQQATFNTMDAASQGYNSLNPAFHNHFEQFSLGDSSQSPQNHYDTLEFEEFVAHATNGGHQQHHHNAYNNKLFELGDLTSSSSSSANTTRTHNTNTTTNCNNNNNNNNNIVGSIGCNGSGGHQQQQQQQTRNDSQQFQLLNNNSSASTNTTSNGPTTCRTAGGLMNNNDRLDMLPANSSPIPSPLSHCMPSPSSPLPIPMSAHSPAHNQQPSLSVQTSPHHSPLHSPHHTSSPLSVSSPGLTMLGGGSMSPVPSPSAHIMHQQHQQHQHQHHNHINNQNPQHLHQHNQTSHNNPQQQSQSHTTTNTTTNIPQIIFSDYSSSRDIFDNLDLDLGQIDEPGLQMLSDQNPIMIADPSIEDSFRRDLN